MAPEALSVKVSLRLIPSLELHNTTLETCFHTRRLPNNKRKTNSLILFYAY